MTKLTGACLHVVAALTLAATCAAQGKRTKPANREQSPPRAPERAIIVGPGVRVDETPPETSYIGNATVNYLPGPNLTLVGVILGDVYRRGEVTANLDLSFRFKGREPVKQGEVEWMFVSDWDIFRRGDPLVVEADGRRFSFMPERVASSRGLHVGQMSFADFELLANSKQARLSVGRVSFALTENQRGALRDMLRVFETPAKSN